MHEHISQWHGRVQHPKTTSRIGHHHMGLNSQIEREIYIRVEYNNIMCVRHRCVDMTYVMLNIPISFNTNRHRRYDLYSPTKSSSDVLLTIKHQLKDKL